jgi:hypothetical protein
MRRAAKVDRNHTEVIRALRAAGCTVFDASRVGGGFPDALVSTPSGSLILMEIKDGSLSPSRRRLTDAEAAFFRLFAGHCVIAESAEQALYLAGVKVA